MSIRPVFVASIGNPSPAYANTLHSTGHIILSHLSKWLLTPPFSRSPLYANGLLSASEDYTLWQSPSLMNLSGKPVAKAWRTFVSSLSSLEEKRAARLVLVHDALELSLGKIHVRDLGTSRGHRGVKDVMAFLPPGMEFTRVRVGIGRCVSHSKSDVAQYVMRKMTPHQLGVMEDTAGKNPKDFDCIIGAMGQKLEGPTREENPKRSTLISQKSPKARELDIKLDSPRAVRQKRICGSMDKEAKGRCSNSTNWTP
ncbi:MAG: hypothetical protein Q9225_001150 [Loekoesia sp. 1 TL-2023]